jgi:hypothetical protein
MLNCSSWALALAGAIVLTVNSHADVLQQDFSANPASAGWNVWGETNLFTWDFAQGKLSVTWDSSRTNSYFYHPLGTVLARDDDFSLAFDLRLQDITTTTKPGPFQIAVGLINFSDATRSDFWRGSGVNAVHGPRNIFEVDYFPAGYFPGYGDVAASISPTLVSMNNGFASGFSLLQLTNNQDYHFELAYTASNTTLRMTLSSGGIPLGPFDDVQLGAEFTDFRLDTAAICSYSDTGDDFDSVLAHGTIDNLEVRMPSLPVQNLTGSPSNGVWVIQFTNRTNWVYTIEKTTDLQSWVPASAALNGNGSTLTFQDPNPLAAAAFYRVRGQRP